MLSEDKDSIIEQLRTTLSQLKAKPQNHTLARQEIAIYEQKYTELT